jgi:putative transposase
MARLPRVNLKGMPQHVIQRGNNRQICFASEQDFYGYISWLKEYSEKYQVEIHAWVLMINHVHLLFTPRSEGGVSQMMQSPERLYVRYFNYSYKRSGTLWEGRYKSCLVQEEDYLLEVYRYIELNPVRARMVTDPAEYKWSSYQENALGIQTNLCSDHTCYLSLGLDEEERQEAYRKLFEHEIDGVLITEIRRNTQQGFALGNEKFKREVEEMTGRRMHRMKMGRPVKNKIDQN